MKKIPTLLVRNPEDRAHVLDQVTPGCEWVIAGEGKPTRKFDGTCTMLDESGKWWARREVKEGRPFPADFVTEDYDKVTGKTQGWQPIEDSPFAKFFDEAEKPFTPGTFELIGPKINGNPDHWSEQHELVRHGAMVVDENPVGIDEVKALVEKAGLHGWEGIVWHHPDGRMAKLKARDLASAGQETE